MLIENLIILEYIRFTQDKGFLYKIYIDNFERYDFIYYDDLFKKLKENNYFDLCTKLNMIKGQEGIFAYSVKTKKIRLLKREREETSIKDEISIENIKKVELYEKVNNSKNENVFINMYKNVNNFIKGNSTMFPKKDKQNIDLSKYKEYKDTLKKKKVKDY